MRHGRDGDEFDQFAVSRWSMALRLAHRLTGDASTAEDLAQEALARMWSRWDRLERDHLDAYLRRTVTNLFYSQVRRRRTRYEQIIRLLPWPKSRTETDRGVEERDELATALLRLPPRQRKARHARVRTRPCWPVGADRDADPGVHYSQGPTGRPRRGRLRPRRPVRPTGPWGRRGACLLRVLRRGPARAHGGSAAHRRAGGSVSDRLRAAMLAYLAGPSRVERRAGDGSIFGPDAEGLLNGVSVDEAGRAVIDLDLAAAGYSSTTSAQGLLIGEQLSAIAFRSTGSLSSNPASMVHARRSATLCRWVSASSCVETPPGRDPVSPRSRAPARGTNRRRPPRRTPAPPAAARRAGRRTA